MRHKLVYMVCILLIFGLIALPKVEAQSSKTFNWKYQSCVPLVHPYGKIFDKHFKSMEKRSNGRLKVQFVSWGETPYKGTEVLRLMRSGLLQTCELLPAYNAGDEPLLIAPELAFLVPRLITDLREYYQAYDRVWNDPKVKALIDEILDDANCSSLGGLFYYWAPNNFYSRVPVTKPGDFKGLKFRAISFEDQAMLKAFGGSGMGLTAPEVYTALQRGLCDGVITSIQAMVSLKWGEVMKYAYNCKIRGPGNFFVVNKNAWKSLPNDLQTIFREGAKAACDEINSWVIDDIPKSIAEAKRRWNWEIKIPTQDEYQAMRALCKTQVWPQWIKRAGPKGPETLNAVLKAFGASD